MNNFEIETTDVISGFKHAANGVRSYVIVCAKRRRIALDKNHAYRIPEKTKEKGLAERRRVFLVQLLIYNNYYTLSIHY